MPALLLTNKERMKKLKELVAPTLIHRANVNANLSTLRNANEIALALDKCADADMAVLLAWSKATQDVNPIFHENVTSGKHTTLCEADLGYLYEHTR